MNTLAWLLTLSGRGEWLHLPARAKRMSRCHTDKDVIKPFAAMMLLQKRPIKVRNLKPLSLSVFFFALARESSLKKAHSFEIRFVIGPKHVLLAGVLVQFSSRQCYRLGQWRGYTVELQFSLTSRSLSQIVPPTQTSGVKNRTCEQTYDASNCTETQRNVCSHLRRFELH